MHVKGITPEARIVIPQTFCDRTHRQRVFRKDTRRQYAVKSQILHCLNTGPLGRSSVFGIHGMLLCTCVQAFIPENCICSWLASQVGISTMRQSDKSRVKVACGANISLCQTDRPVSGSGDDPTEDGSQKRPWFWLDAHSTQWAVM